MATLSSAPTAQSISSPNSCFLLKLILINLVFYLGHHICARVYGHSLEDDEPTSSHVSKRDCLFHQPENANRSFLKVEPGAPSPFQRGISLHSSCLWKSLQLSTAAMSSSVKQPCPSTLFNFDSYFFLYLSDKQIKNTLLYIIFVWFYLSNFSGILLLRVWWFWWLFKGCVSVCACVMFSSCLVYMFPI